MVSRRPLGLEARPSNNNAAVPARVSNLRRGVPINRLLPVRSLRLFRFASLKLGDSPRILSSTPYSAITDLPVPVPSPTDYGYRDGDYYDGLSVRNASAIIAGVVGGTLFVLLTSLGTFAWQRLFAPS
jgi:hypothetical protein